MVDRRCEFPEFPEMGEVREAGISDCGRILGNGLGATDMRPEAATSLVVIAMGVYMGTGADEGAEDESVPSGWSGTGYTGDEMYDNAADESDDVGARSGCAGLLPLVLPL